MCRWHPHSAVDRLVSTVCRWASNLHTSVHPHWSSRLYREMTTEHGLMKVSFPHCCLGFCCQAILTISVRSVNCVLGYRPQNRSWILFLSHSVLNPSGNPVNPAIQTYLDSDHFLLTILTASTLVQAISISYLSPPNCFSPYLPVVHSAGGSYGDFQNTGQLEGYTSIWGIA